MFSVRVEKISDHDDVRRVNLLAFGHKAESELVDSLRNTDNFISELSLVATHDGRIIGHLLVSKVRVVSNDHQTEILSLAPVCVLPEFQDKGVGTMLIKEALTKCGLLGYPAMVVMGSPKFYTRFGFDEASKYGLKTHFNVPSEAYMVVIYDDSRVEELHGFVEYPKQFDNF
jgi:putative acetyltransferase